jgi:hypothetical protein
LDSCDLDTSLIKAGKKGAKCVLFQDFNLEVLTEVTIPNIL